MSPLKLWPSETEDNTHVDFLTVLGIHWLSCPPYTFFLRRGERKESVIAGTSFLNGLHSTQAHRDSPLHACLQSASAAFGCFPLLSVPAALPSHCLGECQTLATSIPSISLVQAAHKGGGPGAQRNHSRSEKQRQAPKQSSGRPKGTHDGLLFMYVPWQDRGPLGCLENQSEFLILLTSSFFSKHFFARLACFWAAAWRAPPHPGILPGVSNTRMPSHTSAFQSSHPHSRYPQDCAAHSGFKIKSQVPDFSKTVWNSFLVVLFIMEYHKIGNKLLFRMWKPVCPFMYRNAEKCLYFSVLWSDFPSSKGVTVDFSRTQKSYLREAVGTTVLTQHSTCVCWVTGWTDRWMRNRWSDGQSSSLLVWQNGWIRGSSLLALKQRRQQLFSAPCLFRIT